MTIPLRRLFAPVLVAAALVVPLVVAGPASADTEVKRDPRGDLIEIAQRAPRPSADVLRLTSTHADGIVKGRVDVADLDTTSFLQVGLAVTTPSDRFFAVLTREEGEVRTVLTSENAGGEVACPSLVGRVLPAADRIAIEVPRLCLDRPRWVRTGAATVAADASRAYLDDARRDGTLAESGGIAVGTKRLFLN